MEKLDRGCRITWLGHAAFRVDTPGGKVLLVDPWLGNPKAPAGAASLERLDVILPTHAHSDHLGDTVELSRRFHPEIPCVFELHLYLQRKGVRETRPMNKGGTQTVAGSIHVTMVSADHSAGLVDDDAAPGQTIYGGAPCGFVVELENGFRFYHAGDTNLFGDMKWIGELYRPEVALLPIGGLFTMGPREAAIAAGLLGVKTVVPMHYGTFPPLAGTPAELERALGSSGVRVVTLQPGETWA
jgi:L-ascorbate metabolism protein UlaG (beta-lactamase superfamily)